MNEMTGPGRTSPTKQTDVHSPALRHYEESAHIPASVTQVFDHVNDHARLSSHMSRSSWMMGGGRMEMQADAGEGRVVGSHIRLGGRIFGLQLFLDEVITEHEPPYRKTWQTVGTPRLLVIGDYRMGVEIGTENGGSRLRVFIDYELPPTPGTRWLGFLFGGFYARWCVRQMLQSARGGWRPLTTTADSRRAMLPPHTAVVVRAAMFLLGLAAWIVALVMLLLGEWWWAAASAASALGADVVGRAWSRRSPVALPFFLWWFLLLPRGPHSPRNLRSVLQPRSGERILEIGPGVGVHAQAIAAALRPDGVLDVIDVQQAMLDRLTRRARRLGLTNIVATQGDARTLPYPAGTFHAAYLVGVLGEVPDPVAALRELHRVLRPDGRLIIGELLLDPDFVSLPALRAKGADAGLAFVRQAGPRFAYWAVFRPAGG